jgi:hypothetical protein
MLGGWQEKMNGFEEQCYQLTDHLKDLQAAYNKLLAERNILQLELKSRENTHVSTSSGRDDVSGQAATSPQSSGQPSRPHRPTPTGWVRPPKEARSSFVLTRLRFWHAGWVDRDAAGTPTKSG